MIYVKYTSLFISLYIGKLIKLLTNSIEIMFNYYK